MIQKIIKLSDYPLLSKFISEGKTILAFNRKNYYTTLNKIKGKQIVYANEFEANKDLGYRENTIEIDFDTKERNFFKIFNGTDGDKGLIGDKGPQGDQGEPYNKNEMTNRGYTPLPIINNDITDDSKAIWSAYRGKVIGDFLKSIAEIVMTDEEYQLLFNENESDTDEYGNPNEYHQIFIDMEFITEHDDQSIALVHTDNKTYKTYVKYWTYENESAILYFKNIGTSNNPIYEEVLDFDLWNDLYLNEDNTETYYTRKLVTFEDPITGNIVRSEYQYTKVETPVWLDLEFTTDHEDVTTILLNSSEISDDGDVSKDDKEEEIIILYRNITNITVDTPKEITIPINSIITKTINIQPSNYINAYIDIEYDENYIKIFEDGRIMALNNACPEGTTIKISAVNRNETTGEYEKSKNIFDTITIKVVIYVENILFDSYNIEGLKETTYKLLPKPSNDAIAPDGVIYYKVIPEDASEQKLEFISSNSECVEIDEDENNINILKFKEEGEATIYVRSCDNNNSRIEVQLNTIVITPIKNIEVQEHIDALIGYYTNIPVTIYPNNATHKELNWQIKDQFAIDEGVTVTFDTNNQIGILNLPRSSEEFTVVISAIDGSNYQKEITIVPKVPVYYINLNTTNVTIDKYDNEHNTYQLEATVNEDADNKTLIWYSDNEDIISVDQNGLVRANSGGTSKITVKSTDGSSAIATCQVTSIILITEIQLPQNLKYYIGNNYERIVPTIKPSIINTSLTWYTSDDTIASVNNQGEITPYKEGKVKVYAVANDNSGVIGRTDIEILIPSRELMLVNDFDDKFKYNEEDKFYELTMNVDETFTVISIVEPDNTSNQNLQYVISDPNDNNIVYVDNNGNITALSQGIATLFVETTDDIKLSQKLKIDVI